MTAELDSHRERVNPELVDRIEKSSGPVPVSLARALASSPSPLDQTFSIRVELGAREEVVLEALRIGVRSNFLLDTLAKVESDPQSFTLAELVDLQKRLDTHAKIDPEFSETLVGNKGFKVLQIQLQTRLQMIDSEVNTSEVTPSALRTDLIQLGSNQLNGIKQVMQKLQGSDPVEGNIQIGIRGGAHSEALGWLKEGPSGNPRSVESVYHRRTGENPPIFDLTSAVNSPNPEQSIGQILEDAGCYARSGQEAELVTPLLAAKLGREPTPEEVRYSDTEYLVEFGISPGVLMVFAAEEGAYPPSFHRNDPRWSRGSYMHVATMETGTRHLRAILPVPDLSGEYLPGAFAMIITPEIRGLSSKIQRELFEAAFVKMDRKRYDAILTAALAKESQKQIAA